VQIFEYAKSFTADKEGNVLINTNCNILRLLKLCIEF